MYRTHPCDQHLQQETEHHQCPQRSPSCPLLVITLIGGNIDVQHTDIVRFTIIDVHSFGSFILIAVWNSVYEYHNFFFHSTLYGHCCFLVIKSCPTLFVTPWTSACQAPLSMGLPRQEYWSTLPFPSPGDLPDPWIQPISPALAGEFFTTDPPGKPRYIL